ncbi:MAG: alanine racemase [Patescibacteria group bacterium]
MFKKRQYKTLNLIEVNGKSLISNYRFFQKLHPESKIAPVLKSNAYGHGLKLVGQFVDQNIKPPFICVDSLYEAYELKKLAKVKTKILLMGYTFPENFKVRKKLDFVVPVFDQETLKVLNRHQPGIEVHLKIDTGMNRLGIRPGQARTFAKLAKKYHKIKINGIYTHLATAGDPKQKSLVQKQVKTFKEVIRIFEQEGFNFAWKHISATDGAGQIFDPEFNLIRLGIGFYGVHPNKSLRPALKLSSHLVQVKTINPGEIVSYGATFKAKKKTKIGILPLGYYDGLDRRLSNRGMVKTGNRLCPIIGRVCMNLTVIDLSPCPRAKVGQKVTVFDDKTQSPNSIANSARLIDTIPYVLLTGLSETTKRVLG